MIKGVMLRERERGVIKGVTGEREGSDQGCDERERGE